MNEFKKSLGALFIGVIGSVIVLVFAVLVIEWANKSTSSLPVYGEVPEFTFTECRGDSFGLADMLGEINIVDFIFTRCEGVCPIMASKFVKLYDLYQEYPDIRFVSISVDPEYDTPEVLQMYAQAQGVYDMRWVFLNAPIEDVIELSEKGFMLPAENLPMGHSAKFSLVDRKGIIRGYYNSQDWASVNVMKTHIEKLYRADR